VLVETTVKDTKEDWAGVQMTELSENEVAIEWQYTKIPDMAPA
jgi:hypothetical protein